jgi:hypothetical protein
MDQIDVLSQRIFDIQQAIIATINEKSKHSSMKTLNAQMDQLEFELNQLDDHLNQIISFVQQVPTLINQFEKFYLECQDLPSPVQQEIRTLRILENPVKSEILSSPAQTKIWNKRSFIYF